MEPYGNDPARAHDHRNAVIAGICVHAWARAQEPTAVREFYLGLSVGQERRSFREIKHYKRRKRWLG